MSELTGKEKAKKLADEIRSENEAAANKDAVDRANALAELGINGLQVDDETAAMFKATADVGTKNISGAALPQLKVTEHGSKKNLLANGQKAQDGSFYYSPTKESFETVMVSIVNISKGFYTAKTEADGKTLKMNPSGGYGFFNQLVGGVILANNMPFVMFASGSRWPALNEFCKTVKPFTKNPNTPVPMYAFKVQLTSALKENGAGKSDNYIVNYNLVSNDKGQVMIISDKEVLKSLPKLSDEFAKMFDGFISKNEVNRETGKQLRGQVAEAVPVETTEPVRMNEDDSVSPRDHAPDNEEVSEADIPF